MQTWKQIVFTVALAAAVVAIGAFSARANATQLMLDEKGCMDSASNTYQIALWRDEGVTRAEAHKRIRDMRDAAVTKGLNPKSADTYATFLSWVADVVYDNPTVKAEALASDFYVTCINAGGRIDLGEKT